MLVVCFQDSSTLGTRISLTSSGVPDTTSLRTPGLDIITRSLGTAHMNVEFGYMVRFWHNGRENLKSHGHCAM